MQKQFVVPTSGRGFYDITDIINGFIKDIAIDGASLCNVFIQHTSASLIITENADISVREDLENYFANLAKDGDDLYKHTDEGIDDMSAHIRAALTRTSLNIPVIDNRLALGTWQGVYLWEHRFAPHNRKLILTVMS